MSVQPALEIRTIWPIALVTAITLALAVACTNTATPTPKTPQPGPQNETEAIGVVQNALADYEFLEGLGCRPYVVSNTSRWAAEELGSGRWTVTAFKTVTPTPVPTATSTLGPTPTPYPTIDTRGQKRVRQVLTTEVVFGKWEVQPSGVVTTLLGSC